MRPERLVHLPHGQWFVEVGRNLRKQEGRFCPGHVFYRGKKLLCGHNLPESLPQALIHLWMAHDSMLLLEERRFHDAAYRTDVPVQAIVRSIRFMCRENNICQRKCTM